VKTYGEQLEEVQNAISAVLKNQRYNYNGREYVRADLDSLRKLEKDIIHNLQTYGNVLPIAHMSTHGAYHVEFH